MVGERFNRFDRGRFENRRGFNQFATFGGGDFFPGWYGYPWAYNTAYPANYTSYDPYANNAYPAVDYSAAPPPVAAQCPGLVAGDVVGNVQRVLRYRGLYRGPINGLSGPETRAAIRAYDVTVGLPPTGVIDARLLASMQLM